MQAYLDDAEICGVSTPRLASYPRPRPQPIHQYPVPSDRNSFWALQSVHVEGDQIVVPESETVYASGLRRLSELELFTLVVSQPVSHNGWLRLRSKFAIPTEPYIVLVVFSYR